MSEGTSCPLGAFKIRYVSPIPSSSANCCSHWPTEPRNRVIKTKNNAPRSLVNKFRLLAGELAGHYLGEKASRLTFEDAGVSNFVFSVRAGSSTYFIRISPTPTALDS